jgi:putative alpha-1,2-mannosidase
MKVGISYVSLANAKANLDAENSAWDFDGVRKQAEAKWNEVLNRVQVSGGSQQDLEKFYTALYHVFQSPNVASDVNGEYMGFDKKVHVAEGVRYQNYSGWDIIRSWTHLVAAIAPETPDIMRSMVQDGVEGGLLPFWTHQNVETRVMVGDPGTVNVANAYAMGVRGFDTNAALALMKKSADDPSHTHRWGLSDWIEHHVVNNAATTLEYAMADFALAQFAQQVGDDAAYQKYLKRSDYWRESFNPETGFIAPRTGTPGPGAAAARIYELGVYGPSAPSTNLAIGGAAKASGSCNSGETPEHAINGSNGDKWCDNSSSNKWLEIDLGSVKDVDKIVLAHAGAGGESSSWNTQDFTISVSTNRQSWTTVATVTGNTQNVTNHTFAAKSARYVKLAITAPIHAVPAGQWDCLPFKPGNECGFVEGNAAQYVWMVPQNLESLFSLMGGHQKAISRLDDLFSELNAGTNRPYFYIGNEPEHGTPWTYNFAGAPAKTREVVRRIIDEEFSTKPAACRATTISAPRPRGSSGRTSGCIRSSPGPTCSSCTVRISRRPPFASRTARRSRSSRATRERRPSPASASTAHRPARAGFASAISRAEQRSTSRWVAVEPGAWG